MKAFAPFTSMFKVEGFCAVYYYVQSFLLVSLLVKNVLVRQDFLEILVTLTSKNAAFY